MRWGFLCVPRGLRAQGSQWSLHCWRRARLQSEEPPYSSSTSGTLFGDVAKRAPGRRERQLLYRDISEP